MEALQNRIDSFSGVLRIRSGQKSTILINWPHTKNPKKFQATPAALAEAGFYYEPTQDDPDNVTCFECGKQLSEWEKEDDPFDIHWRKCGDRCSWAAVRCGLRADMDSHGRFTFPDKTRLPGTKKMEKARLGTFTTGDGWIHDQPSHGANSPKMALAGFVWTPQHPGDDLATCLYCNIALSGWEKDDDPMEEHRKRVKPGEPCPFVTYGLTGNISQAPSAASVTSTATTSPSVNRPTRSNSLKPSKAAPNPSQSSQPSKAAKTRGASVDKRKTRKIAEEETTDNMDEDDGQPPIQHVSRDEDSDAPRPKRTRSTSVKPPSRSQSKVAPAPFQPSRPSKAAKTRGKSVGRRKTQKIVEEEVADEEDGEDMSLDEDSEVPQRQLTRSTSVKPSKAMPARSSKAAKGSGKSVDRRKTRVVTEEETIDNVKEEDPIQDMSLEELGEPPQPPPTRSNTVKPLSRSQSRAAVPPSRVSKATKTRGKSVDRRKTRKVTEEETTDNMDEGDDYPPVQYMSQDEHSKPLAPQQQPTQSFAKISTSGSQIQATPAPAKAKGKTTDRRKTRKVAEDTLTDNPDEGDDRFPVQDEYSKTPAQQQLIQPTPKATPTPSHSQTSKATKAKGNTSDRRETRKIVEDETTDNPDERDPHASIHNLSQDEDSETPAPPHLRPTQVTAAKQPPNSHPGKTPAPSRLGASKVPKTTVEQFGDGRKVRRVAEETADEVDEKHAQPAGENMSVDEDGGRAASPGLQQETDGERKTSIHKKTPPPVELLALNFDNTPKATTPLPVHVPYSTDPGAKAPSMSPTVAKLIPRPKTPESQLLPPLSRIPFMPLQSLTDAELDMTVEEWIRYQMEVEFDKLKRDGERELVRFKAQAEEVRKLIESL